MQPENEEQITLYNTIDVDQAAYSVDGKRYTMTAHEIRPWPRDIAQLFLTQRSRFVQLYRAIYIPPSPGEDIVWIANVTGNPFVPEMLTRTRLDRQRGIEETFEVPNPLRTARPVEFELQSEQKIVEGKYGIKESQSFPPRKVKLPPTIRVPTPRSVSEWLLRRDAQQGDGFQGSLIQCRAPAAFEVNETWPIEEMLIYADMVDQRTKWKTFVGKSGDDHEKKLTLWRALFHRVIDERYELPTREYFELVKSGQTGHAADVDKMRAQVAAKNAASGAHAR